MSSARAIALALGGPHAQRLPAGGFLIRCPVPSHGKGRGDRSPSLHISDGASRVLVHCYAGCDPRDVLETLRQRRLLDGRPTRTTTSELPKSKAPDAAAYARKQHRSAAWLWARRLPTSGTPTEAYLARRGITCPLPPTLRYLPPRKLEHHPAMIAAFALPDEIEPGVLGEPSSVEAVHLTLLAPDGTKAAVEKPKLTIGSPAALPIVVAPPSDLMGLVICEGIEDALTVHAATGLGAWAAGSAGRMPALAAVVPEHIEAVTVYAHADPAGRKGADGLAAALRLRGIEVVTEGL
jgi:hypothetical protein